MIDSILEKAGLHSLASNEILSTPGALNIASTYARENYAECRCALLFGSHSRGEQKLFSDLDILIILPKFAPGRGPEMLRIVENGVRLEVFLLTEKTFSDALISEQNLGMKFFYSIINEGIVVAGAAEVAEKLRHLAKLQKQDERKIADRDSLVSARVQITSQLIKLSCAKEHFDRVHYAAHAFNALGLAIMRLETGENISVEKFPKKFSEHDPAAAQAFQYAFLNVCTTGDTSDFMNSAGALLDRLGGPAWSGITVPIRLPAGLGILRMRLMALLRRR
jgi:predicted nucleotidyltransferase